MGKNEFQLEVVSVRLVKESSILSAEKITTPETAVRVMGEVLGELDREVVGVINLKADGTPINCHIASMGSLNGSLAEPRELLKAGILSNACSMILVHNHPSGDLSPSKEDIAITDRMVKVCGLVGIPLIDHVIVGGDSRSYFSFQERGMVKYPENRGYATEIGAIELGKTAERSKTDGREIYGRGTGTGKKR